jgi:transposase
VLQFLNAKIHTAAKIQQQLCGIYRPSVMSKGRVWQWVRKFKDRRTNMHDDHSGRPSIMNDNLVEKLNNKINENQQFTVSELLTCFPLISHALLYETVVERLHYHEIRARWVPTMRMDEQKRAARDIILNVPSAIQQHKAQKFLDHCVTGDETWISYSNVETRKQIHGLEA